MHEELERRLQELKHELQLGEVRLRELDLQQTQLRETMLRIDGAIRVLNELLAQSAALHPSEESNAADSQASGQPY